MKKTKLFGALALASCVMLSGCDIGKKKEEPTPAPAPEVSIVVSENLPEYVVVGTEYDLDQYVTVANTQTAYTVSLSEASKDLVTVNGHKVTPVAEGDISFTVSVEGKSAQGSVESIYQIRKDFMDFSEGLVDNYAGFHIDIDTTTYEVSVGGFMSHSSKYTLDEYFEEDSEGYVPGGFIELDDRVYSYTLSVEPVEPSVPNRDGEEPGDQTEYKLVPDFKLYGDEPLDFSSVISSFALKASDFEVELGTEEEPAAPFGKDALFLPASAANLAKLDKMLAGQIDASAMGWTFAGAYVQDFGELEFTDEVTGEKEERQSFAVIPLYTSESTTTPTYFIDSIYGLVEAEELVLECLDEFLESGETPKGKDFSGFEEAIKAFASQEEFNIVTQYGSFIDGSLVNQAEAYYYDLPLGSYCSGTLTSYVTPTQVHIEESGMEDLSFGYILHDEKVYSYGDFVPDEPLPVDIVVPGADVEGKFPAHAIYEMFHNNGVEANIPEYVAAEPAEFELYEMEKDYSDIYVNSTEAEYLAYKDALLAQGWTLLGQSGNDYLLRFSNTAATVTLGDYIEDYGQYNTYFRLETYPDGHYVATELKDATSLADLSVDENKSFFTEEIIDPQSLEEFTVYDPIFVNAVTSVSQEVNKGTTDEPDMHVLTQKTAEFSGESGIYLLYYLGYLSVPSAPTSDDRWTLKNGMNAMFYFDYQWDADMSVSFVYDETAEELVSVTIKFIVDLGAMDFAEEGQPANYHNVGWGFVTTFDFSQDIPDIEIEYPENTGPLANN